MIQCFKVSIKLNKNIFNSRHKRSRLPAKSPMQYKEITKKEIEQNIWTVLLKNKDSVLSIKGRDNSVCDECENNLNRNKKKKGLLSFLICGDKEIKDRKKGYTYYKCFTEVNGCKNTDNMMIILLQQ